MHLANHAYFSNDIPEPSPIDELRCVQHLQVLPMERINLHFTSDPHVISTASEVRLNGGLF